MIQKIQTILARGAFCLACIWLPVTASALDNSNVCEAVDEAEVIDETVLNQIALKAANVGEVVGVLAVDQKPRVKRAVRYSLVQNPGQVSNIVGDSLENGASTEDIAVQCDCDISDQLVPELVGSAIAHGADAQTIVSRCMKAMRAGAGHELVNAALANADPEMMEAILSAALKSFQFSGPEGRDELVNLLITGDYMLRGAETSGCGADCQYPAAVTLINYLTEQVVIEPPGSDIAPVNPDLVDLINEPPLSDS